MKEKILIMIFTLLLLQLHSQESTLLGVTLPEDIYYELDGSWRFDLSSAIKGDPTEVFQNFIFEMTPDLTATIWLFNKFFFETEITEISENNLFLFGYQSSDPGLQEVRLGNSELNIDEYAGYMPPESEVFNPGTRLKYVTEKTTQELLVRYSKEVLDSVTYIGNRLIEEESIPVTNYLRGQFFTIDNFSGNEKLYTYNDSLEELERDSYIYFRDKKLLYIREELINIYISGTTKNSLGSEDLETATLEGIDLISLYKSGTLSPLEFLGAYKLEGEIGENNRLIIDGRENINYEIFDNILLLYNYSNTTNPREIRYPLEDINENIYSLGSGLDIPINIYFRSLTEVDSIVLDDSTMENSFYITVNGVLFTDFSFDPETKIVTINRELSPFDIVEIKYKNSSDSGTGNLLGVYGGYFTLTDKLSMELSTAGNWSFINDDYSREIDESNASVNMAGKLNYSSQRVNGWLKGNFSLNNPDTSKGFELFNYESQSKILPLTALNLLTGTSGNIPLITREGNYIIDSIEDLENLTSNSLSTPYILSYSDGNSSQSVIVLEVPNLGTGESSSGIIGLEDEAGDYSSYKSLTLELLSETERDIEIRFDTGDGGFSKTVTTNDSNQFQNIKIDFEYDQRQSLKYLEKIEFIFSEGSGAVTLIKGIEFKGDRVWTYDSNGTIYLSEFSDNLKIENIDSSSIRFETFINDHTISNYRELKFNLENSGVITEDSIITVDILSSNKSSYRYTIGPGLDMVSNIKINTSDGEGIINSSNENKIIIAISETMPGTLEISPIILSDPKYNIDSNYSGYIGVNTDIGFKLQDYDFISLDTIYTLGSYSDKESIISGGLTGNLLFGGYTIEGGYIEDLNLSYSYLFPNFDSPLYFSDSFSFMVSSTRENYIEVDMDNFNLKYSLKGYKSDISLIRENRVESFLDSPLLFQLEATLNQEENISSTPELEDIVTSYGNIIPVNTLGRENSFTGFTTLGTTLGVYSPSLSIGGDFTQNFNNLYRISTNYNGNITNRLDLGSFEFILSISSDYSKNRGEDQPSSLLEGYSEFVELFQDNNPFNSLTLPRIYLDSDPIEGYDLSSEMGINIELDDIETPYNFLIPSGLGFAISKEGVVTGDLFTSSRNFTTTIEFKFNNIIKNSGSVTYKEGLLNVDNMLSINIDTLILWEINREDTLNINNSYTYSDLGYTNLSEVDYSWIGKSGPIYIVPIADYLIDSPYRYIHTERGYFLFGKESYKVGLRHESRLEIIESNETEAYIDIIYEDNENEPFSFSLGINTTLIF